MSALRQTVNEWRGKVPAYGTSDCCQFVARYVALSTGIDHAKAFSYEDEQTADALIEKHGGLVGVIASVLGEPKSRVVPPGSVVVVDVNGIESAGIYVDGFTWTIAVGRGLVRTSAPIIAWWPVG